MKILIVHNRYKQYGGEDTVVEQELLAYKNLGHRVELYLEDNAQLNLMDLFLSIFNPKSLIKLKKKIKDFNPDIIHIHNIVFRLSPAIFWSIPKKIKVFITIHNYRFICPSGTLFYNDSININSMQILGLARNIWKGVYQDSKAKTLVLALIYRLNFVIGTFNRIDKYIFLTPFAMNLHQKWKPQFFSKALIKPNFLVKTYEETDVIKKIDLIFVGRFTIEKGILDILPVLINNTELVIHLVGDGPKYDEVKKLVKNSENITLHGSKSREEVLKFINNSKFLIFPSLWFEGMPMTILEAYSKGVPVISRNIGGMKNMIFDGVTGFHYNNLKELSNTLDKLKDVDYTKISNNAKQDFYEKYSQSRGLKNLELLINENFS